MNLLTIVCKTPFFIPVLLGFAIILSACSRSRDKYYIQNNRHEEVTVTIIHKKQQMPYENSTKIRFNQEPSLVTLNFISDSGYFTLPDSIAFERADYYALTFKIPSQSKVFLGDFYVQDSSEMTIRWQKGSMTTIGWGIEEMSFKKWHLLGGRDNIIYIDQFGFPPEVIRNKIRMFIVPRLWVAFFTLIISGIVYGILSVCFQRIKRSYGLSFIFSFAFSIITLQVLRSAREDSFINDYFFPFYIIAAITGTGLGFFAKHLKNPFKAVK